MTIGVWSLGFGVLGLGLGVWGLGLGVWSLEFGGDGLGFGVWSLEFGGDRLKFDVWSLGVTCWGLGFGVEGGPASCASEALEQSGNNLNAVKDFRTEHDSSQGLDWLICCTFARQRYALADERSWYMLPCKGMSHRVRAKGKQLERSQYFCLEAKANIWH